LSIAVYDFFHGDGDVAASGASVIVRAVAENRSFELQTAIYTPDTSARYRTGPGTDTIIMEYIYSPHNDTCIILSVESAVHLESVGGSETRCFNVRRGPLPVSPGADDGGTATVTIPIPPEVFRCIGEVDAPGEVLQWRLHIDGGGSDTACDAYSASFRISH
jgi:hypothetical protein